MEKKGLYKKRHASAAERKGHIRRWVSLLISPVVWTACFSLLYLLDEAVCGLNRGFDWGGNETTAVVPIMLLLILLTLGIIAANAYFGWKTWRHVQQTSAERVVIERDIFMTRAALMLSGLFAFLTLGLVAVVIWLHPC